MRPMLLELFLKVYVLLVIVLKHIQHILTFSTTTTNVFHELFSLYRYYCLLYLWLFLVRLFKSNNKNALLYLFFSISILYYTLKKNIYKRIKQFALTDHYKLDINDVHVIFFKNIYTLCVCKWQKTIYFDIPLHHMHHTDITLI